MSDTLYFGPQTDERGTRNDPNTIGVGMDGPKGLVEPGDVLETPLMEGITSLVFNPDDWRAFLSAMTLLGRYRGWLTAFGMLRFAACITEAAAVEVPSSEEEAIELRSVAFSAARTLSEQVTAFRHYLAWCCQNRDASCFYASTHIVDFLCQDGASTPRAAFVPATA